MSGKTILIVEDNEIQREGLTIVLRKAGYDVLPSEEGGDAIATLNRIVAPDLVILDMMMPTPATDGWRFMEERKKYPALSAIPVLIMTAMDAANREWAESLGARGLLRKPVETPALLAEVRRCLGERQE
jgi:CheY-like chemotaxis protein